MKNKFYTLLFLLVISALTLYFPLRLHHSLNTQKTASKTAVFSSTFYNDAFYYLCIADNYSKTEMNTYDGVNPTNGYHFLWQNILNVAFTGVDDKQTQVEFAFILSLIFTLAAYLILFLQVFRMTGSRILALFTLFPGYFYMFFSLALGPNYSPWSVINGMESGLGLLLFSVFLLISLKFSSGILSEKSFYSVSSIVLALLVLARLDEIFLLISFIAVVFLYSQGNKIKNILLAGAVPVLFLIIYVVYNQIQFGLMLPVSGLIKTSFGFGNLGHILNALLTGRSFDYLSGEYLYARILPLIIPLIFVPVFAHMLEKKKVIDNKNMIFLFRILSYYIILKSLYLLFFVDFWNQGYWYFYNQVLIFNIMLTGLVGLYFRDILKKKTLQVFAVIVIVFFAHSYFLNYEKNIMNNGKLNRNNTERINQLISQTIPDGKIVEFDDGIISYSTDNECLSGFGLCIDKQGYDAIQNNKFLDLAFDRGYRYLASVNYFKTDKEIPGERISANDFLKVPFFALRKENLAKWRFKAVLKDSISGVIVIKFNK
jgi:hypothetical protein